MENTFNIYSSVDSNMGSAASVERVFISHRNADKPLATAVATLFDKIGLHYWFDRDDEDLRRAAKLGLAGDQVLVHAIERGIKHSSRVLGLLSANTRGSWWVPYEIAASRGSARSISFLVLESIRTMESLPEYVRLAANYWSVDELVRWAASLRAGHLNAPAPVISEQSLSQIENFVPRDPPAVTPRELSARALAAIDRLAQPETQEALRLTSTDRFDWLPTGGGFVRDVAYDLLAPLAFFRLNEGRLSEPERGWLKQCYEAVTLHYELAEVPPRLPYHPEEEGWQYHRYRTPASSWLQGLSIKQRDERLDRFFLVPDLKHNKRLATKEEFKAKFDRILASENDHERRSLGVLMNPLFGFTPTS